MDFLNSKSDAVLFIDPQNPTDHATGFLSTWSMYAELKIALERSEGRDMTDSSLSLRPYARDFARYYGNPDNIPQYGREGLLRQPNGQRLHFISMNPLYPESPHPHPRYAPATVYALTRSDDVEKAGIGSPELSFEILRKLTEATAPYIGIMPYIMPDDDRFLLPEYKLRARACARLKEAYRHSVQYETAEGGASQFILALMGARENVGLEDATSLLDIAEDGKLLVRFMVQFGFLKLRK